MAIVLRPLISFEIILPSTRPCVSMDKRRSYQVARLQELAQNLEDLQKKFQTMAGTSIDDATTLGNISKLTEERDVPQEEVAWLKMKVAEREKTVDAFPAVNGELAVKHAALMRTLQKTTAAQEGEHDELLERLRDSEENKTTLQRERADLEKSRHILTQKVQELDADLDAVKNTAGPLMLTTSTTSWSNRYSTSKQV
jgi:chromosome segregation ATPase